MNNLNGWTPIDEMPEEWKVDGKEFLICGGTEVEGGYGKLPKEKPLGKYAFEATYVTGTEICGYKLEYPGYHFADVNISNEYKDACWFKPEFVKLPYPIELPDCLKERE